MRPATEEAKATLKENIIQAGVSLVEEAAGELLEQQREKSPLCKLLARQC